MMRDQPPLLETVLVKFLFNARHVAYCVLVNPLISDVPYHSTNYCSILML